MPLDIVQTTAEELASASVLAALRSGISSCGSAVLLVPSFAQALEAQRVLAGEAGLSLAVTTTTPAAWVRERWEVWGDGRSIADHAVSCVVARETILGASPEELGPMELSEGLVDVLGSLAGSALPWLPLDESGTPCEDVCAEAGLTHAETLLVGLCGAFGRRLHTRGYVTASEAGSRVVGLMTDSGASVAPVVFAGFSSMDRMVRDLVAELAGVTKTTVVARVGASPASQEARSLVDSLAATVEGASVANAPASEPPQRDPQLQVLLDALFGEGSLVPGESTPVELLLPAGPVAEAEAVTAAVERLSRGESGPRSVVVVVPGAERARRGLLPKLAARGIPARIQGSRPLAQSATAQAFFGFAATVAHLVDLDASWPAPEQGLEGPVARLGDMSWWPPRALTDFLLSDISHVPAAAAWRLDAQWRGNRLLTPRRVLEALQAEGSTSGPVARATQELLRGRLGSAAARLLAPFASGDAAMQGADDARAVLQAVISLAGTLHELGLTADPAAEGSVSLSELVEVATWAAMGVSLVNREEAIGSEGAGGVSVRIMGPGAASQLPPASVDALVLCGLTTAESPVTAPDDLVSALLERLGVEEPRDAMASARTEFCSLVAAARSHVVCERTLYDADSKPTYPSVMLSELLAAYGISADETRDLPLRVSMRGETSLGENLAPAGAAPESRGTAGPSPAGHLSDAVRELVFVPQDGSDVLPGGLPVLSASQVETYLDCPYKWFSLRRLRLGVADAGHTGMEMGTFAHRMMEVTHRELLLRALEAEASGQERDELLAAIEADPARHVAGSRITPENLEAARMVLDLEFDLHQQHMYMVKRPRLAQQLLVAHNVADRASEDQLREDLLSALGYEAGILAGFEPRLFEWSFGRHGNLVPYAGAYFTGTVDRIDVSPHGDAVIIDYKHKSPGGFAGEYDALQEGVLEGEELPRRVQSLIYAQVVRRAFAGRLRLVGSVYLSTKAPHALAGVADENVADLVFGRLSRVRAQRVCVPKAQDGTSGMDALLDRTEELVAEKVRQMLAGNVEANPRDRHSCDFCPVMQCERRVAR